MGPLRPTVGLSDYDALILSTMNPVFYVRPGPSMPTYTAWESFVDATSGDIAQENIRGKFYFAAWVAESGNTVGTYDATVSAYTAGVPFNLLPGSSMPTYSSWESRATAYSSNIALETVRGRIYFRAWFDDSGNDGTYEDIMNDTQIGTIFKVEDTIV